MKVLLSPRWAYLILDTPEGGLFKKLDEEDIYDSSVNLLPHILRIQDTILRVKYINLTDFYPNLYQNSHAKVLKQSRRKSFVTSEI